MVEITLTKNKKTIISKSDFKEVSKYKWYAYTNRGLTYAGRTVYVNGVGRIQQLHIFLLGTKDGYEIDHINRDSLDNRRSNLRFLSHSDNCFNRRKKPNTTSKYIGVSLNKNTGKWVSYIKKNGVLYYLGSFNSEDEAMNKRLQEEKKYFNL